MTDDLIGGKVSGLIETIAYGPIESRRLGHSLGVNLLPRGMKICSFNCPYCECGWTDVGATRRRFDDLPWPTPGEVGAEVAAMLRRCRADGWEIAHVTMAGNGEPTLHPEFGACVEELRAVRDAVYPAAKLSVLSNATTLDDPAVVEALGRVDARMMKLDAGTDAMIRAVNVPLCEFSIFHAVDRFAALPDVIVQAMFVGGRTSNATPEEVEPWIELVARARPIAVQIYTIERRTPDVTLERVPRARLDEIAARLRDRTGIEAQVFG